jgi:hypothetical protein
MIARPIEVNSRTVLLVLIAASFVSAPVSWIDDGLTPSMIVYPLVLLGGLWRMWLGHGMLYFGIAATVFLLVHFPFALAALFGHQRKRGRQPLQRHGMAHHAVHGAAIDGNIGVPGLARGSARVYPLRELGAGP